MSDDIEVSVRVEHQRGLPAVNIKVWPPADLSALLPLDLGQVKEVGQEEFITVTTEPGFNAEWIDALPESTRQSWWDQACEDGFELAKELARETFGPHVSVWQEGRSGGWLTVEGLGDPREWEREQMAAWQPFAEAVKQLVAGTTYRWLWLLNANVFEAGEDEPEEEATDGFRVEIRGEYGVRDGSIHLFNGDTEIVMWDSAEWEEDPSLVFVIANAIARRGVPTVEGE